MMNLATLLIWLWVSMSCFLPHLSSLKPLNLEQAVSIHNQNWLISFSYAKIILFVCHIVDLPKKANGYDSCLDRQKLFGGFDRH